MTARTRSALPGFGPVSAVTLGWARLIVAVPLCALVLRALSLGPAGIAAALGQPRVYAALRLSFGCAALAAAAAVPLGLLLAWVLVRLRFPGRRLLDSLVDLPFALPTAVAGITLTDLFGPNGLLGRPLGEIGVKVDHVRQAVLIGVDLGPNLSVTGSLATILWLAALRREGQDVGAWRFFKLGMLVMPPARVLALGAVFLPQLVHAALSR